MIKRVAFGYTDMEYFFLKIKATLLGIHFSMNGILSERGFHKIRGNLEILFSH